MEEKQLYKTLIRLALPIVIQSMVSACLGMADTVMLGSLGDGAIAAVGLANQYFFTFAMIIAGMGSGCSMFLSQYYGKGDIEGARTVVALTIRLMAVFGAAFTVITLTLPEWIIRFFSKDPELIALGSTYLSIIGWTIPAFALTTVLAASLRSIRYTAAPMYASVTALLVNVAFNYIFIYGKLGLEPMGIRGAALATLLSRVVEVSLLLIITYGKRTVIALTPADFKPLPPDLLRRYVQATTHVVLNDWLYSFASTIYMVAYAHLGKQVLASLNVAGSVQNVLFTVIGGIATASAILVGAEAGKNDVDATKWVGRRCLRFTIAVGLINSVVLFLLSPYAPRLFAQEAATYAITVDIVRIYAVVLVARFINYVLAAGVLRGGGDTRWVMLVELATVWLIAVPLAYIGVYVLQWPIQGVVSLVMLEELVKCALMLWRFYRANWMHNVTI